MQVCKYIYKTWLITSLIAITLTYVLIARYYDLSTDLLHLRRFNVPTLISSDDTSTWPKSSRKTILFWNTMFGNETFYFGAGDVFGKCHGIAKNCWATHHRTIINVEDFDAILYHGNDLDIFDVPLFRRQQQYYIYVNLESPENRPLVYSEFNYDFFNLTMTYRLDSDIVWPYANVREIISDHFVAPKRETVWESRKVTDRNGTSLSLTEKNGTGKNTILVPWKKTKSVVWFVSNCESRSRREKYVDELKLHIDIDIYGLCGMNVRSPKGQDHFREVIEPEYYFYLSFENSMCQDYVTEKLYWALKYDVIPIVYGGANYSLFAPPRSYINALDFDSPMDLAIYLKRLIAQPTEYDKYFEWKKTYKIVKADDHVICQLCEYLNSHDNVKSYSPLSAWYMSDKCPLQDKLLSVPYITKQDLRNGR